MRENHKKFLNHLDDSTESVFISALYLYKKGCSVKINAMEKASSHKDWKSCRDDGDLEVYKNNNKYRVEVKGLSADFTCAEDWKYGNKFIVCAKHSYDQAKTKPYAYMILNKNRTHVAIVKTTTKNDWYVEYRKDSRYNDFGQECYFCPLDKIEWRKL
tara:strand:+ start:84 stop:557 length:474 start_codon:yes stop_codon:yes gene_type:complete